MTTLTSDQKTALIGFRAFMLSDISFESILTGGAGTGKSFVVKQILDTLNQIYSFGSTVKGDMTRYEPILCATTNKAAIALTEQVKQEVVTLHSLFKLIPVWNPVTRKNELKKRQSKKNESNILEDKLLIIDEYSYIDQDLYKLIQKHTNNCKFLFVGDHCQLPPVGSDLPYIYTLGLPTFHLNEIVRQKSDNLIAALSLECRTAIDKGLPLPKLRVDNKNVFYVDESTFQHALLGDIQNGLNAMYLGYTNIAVQRYNEGLYKIFAKSNRSYNNGDPVVVNSAIKAGDGVLKTESIVFLDKVTEGHFYLPHSQVHVPGYHMTIEGYQYFMPLDLSMKDAVTQHVDTPLDLSEEINETWISVRHAYACTVHKSQGSTFDAVYIDLNDIAKAGRMQSYELYKRLIYVALSRPRTKLVFTGVLW